MRLTLKALTVMLTMAFIVALAGDVMAQRGRGGEGRGLGPGGGLGGGTPGSAGCINACPYSETGCPYFGTGRGYGTGYGRAARISRQNIDSGQKAFGYNRGMYGRGFGRGQTRR